MSWDKFLMRRSFSRAANQYEQLAGLQRRVGEELLSYLLGSTPTGWIMDIGAGTGRCGRYLQQRYPRPPLLLVDIAEGMIQRAQSQAWRQRPSFLVGDAESLPLQANIAGLIVSNLALQWCLYPDNAMSEFARVLRPGGELVFSTFGEGTLKELRQAWANVDGFTHVNQFVSKEYIAATMIRAGFEIQSLEVQHIRLQYPSVLHVLREIKGIGAHNVTSGRPRGLTGKQKFQQMIAHYEEIAKNGKISSSYVVIYGHGRKCVKI